jgi:hypothetical protein
MNLKIRTISVALALGFVAFSSLTAASRTAAGLRRVISKAIDKPMLLQGAAAPKLFLPLPKSTAVSRWRSGVIGAASSCGHAAGETFDAVREGVADESIPGGLCGYVVIPVAQEYLGNINIEEICSQLEECDLELGYHYEHTEKKSSGVRALAERAIEFIQDHKATTCMLSTAAISFAAAGAHIPHTLPFMLLSAAASAGITCGVSWFFKRQHDFRTIVEEALRSGAWSVVCMGVNVGVVLPIGEEVLGTLLTRVSSGAVLSACAEAIRSVDKKILIQAKPRIETKDLAVCAVWGALGGVAAVGISAGKDMLWKAL